MLQKALEIKTKDLQAQEKSQKCITFDGQKKKNPTSNLNVLFAISLKTLVSIL